MIEVLIHFRKQSASKEVMLMETAVQMSHLLYMPEAERNSRNILRLYNCFWVHQELSCMLNTNVHKKMTAVTFFGAYLHSLVIHAPLQMEIISLPCLITKNQERIFEQAQRSAMAASNRHPQNVLCSTILRQRQHSRNQPMHSSLPTVLCPKPVRVHQSIQVLRSPRTSSAAG